MSKTPLADAKKAKAQQPELKHYHGSPCRNCSGTLRYIVNGGCVQCVKTAAAVRLACTRRTW